MINKKEPNRFLIAFTKLTAAPAAYLFFKPKVYYENRKKQSLRLPKPCIIMSNHVSLLDFPLCLALFPFKTLRFLMAEVLFEKGWLLSWFLYKMGGIYVNRNNADFSFMEEAVTCLECGGTVGVFPEGRLPVNGKPFPFKPGIALLAAYSHAPIVPVCIGGEYGAFKRVKVLIGEKIYYNDFFNDMDVKNEDCEKFTLMLEEKIISMKKRLKSEDINK